MKKILTYSLICAVLASSQITVAHTTLEEGYTQVATLLKANNTPFGMTYNEFESAYKASNIKDIQQFTNTYLKALSPAMPAIYRSSNDGSSPHDWYYNTGLDLPEDANPTYTSDYNLMNLVKKGDIIFEANGGHGLTAHVCIVEGVYHSETKNQDFIRIIEANTEGVIRSCLDDTRVEEQKVTILRVPSASETQINHAVDFCKSQLGKSYKLDFGKDLSRDEKDWYCSEIVWAAYKHEGIDLESSSINEPGITPRDIKHSSNIITIPFK